MPKRDSAYMENQRTSIAQAALEVMLEKGLQEASLRDICARAGVSHGALYVHFANKNELLVEVCQLPIFPMAPDRGVRNWNDYLAPVRFLKTIHRSQEWRRRIRLSLQFAAELAVSNDVPDGASQLLRTRVRWHRDSLQTLHRQGEILLPLGLDHSAEIHHRLTTGTWYMIAADHELDIDKEVQLLIEAFATTAGLAAINSNEVSATRAVKDGPRKLRLQN